MRPEQTTLLSAALRHVADAEHLLEEGPHHSPDQAWHLGGFGPECVRKACLEDEALYRVLGHDLGQRAEALLDWGVSLDPHASRYDLGDWAARTHVLEDWSPQHRYERTGARTAGVASDLVAAARALVDRVHGDLWADGRITGRDS